MYKALSPGNIGHGMRFAQAAEAAAKFGFEGYWFGLEGDSEMPVAATKELLAKTGLKAAGFNLTVDYRKDEQVFNDGMAKFESYIKYAVEIGANRCATWLTPTSATLPYKENFELHRSRLKKICEVLDGYGIVFGMEFVGPPKSRVGAKYEFIYNLDQTLELCGAIGTKNAGLLLDVWHWDLAGQKKDDFKKFGADRVALVHINDAPAGIPPDEQSDGVRKLPGETGVLRIGEFFDGLKSIGYDGPVAPEPFEKTLKDMTYEKALEVVMQSVDKVWPK